MTDRHINCNFDSILRKNGIFEDKIHTLLAHFKEQIIKLLGSTADLSLLVAVSGGIDSVTLAYLCYQAKLNFAICHVNYHLRSEDSNLDEKFVKELAASFGVQYHSIQADLSAYEGNIQLEARNIRYAFFENLCAQNNYDHILMGHHLDDVAETFLFNLGRGTGIEGLLSIPETNGKIIRPLLNFTKADIQEYAAEEKLNYREDDSNTSDKYARNKLRLHAIPKLKDQNPNFLLGVKKNIEHLKASEQFAKQSMSQIINEAILEKSNERIVIRSGPIQSSAFSQNLAFHWLQNYGFTSGQVFDFFEKKQWENGAYLKADAWQLTYDRAQFVLSKINPNRSSKIKFNPRHIGKIQFNNYLFEFSFCGNRKTDPKNKELAYFDAELISTIQIRYWQAGDRFQPFGMNGNSKTIKKFFTDEKFALDQKSNTPLLLSGKEIMWICGYRTDHRHQPNDKTTTYLKVTIKKI